MYFDPKRLINQEAVETFIMFKVPEFQQENYTQNFIQCTLDAGLGDKKKVRPSWLEVMADFIVQKQ